MKPSATILCFALAGCSFQEPGPGQPFVPPDGGPLRSKAWITTTLGRLDSVSGSTRTSIHSGQTVLGGELPVGPNDPRQVRWEFVGRQEGRDLHRVSLVEASTVLADARVEYAGGIKPFEVGGVRGKITDRPAE